MDDLISRQAAISRAVTIPMFGRDIRVVGVSELESLPSAQPEIIRCKDCKYRGGLSGFYCDIVEKAVGVDSFCSWAERRIDD